MYLISAIKMAECLIEIIDDDVSQNHCVSNCSSTKTDASGNLSQHILARIVCKIGNLTFFVKFGMLSREWSSGLCCRNITDSTYDHSIWSLKACASSKCAESAFFNG